MEITFDENSTDSWGPTVNFTETEEVPLAVNATAVRIVGGVLEKQGRSPWQVCRRSFTSAVLEAAALCSYFPLSVLTASPAT